MRVVATAGHVDHGKSSLVLAITGTDPDRLAEEKRRGLTIDLGFAFAELPSGQVVGFVDVPGHMRFVKNMLAGVGAVDIAMLIVAANEGWMPQTAEHAAILELLHIEYGLIALTKIDLVDTETVELARLDVVEHVTNTPLENWPIVPVDSRSANGLGDLIAALDAVVNAAADPRDCGRPRLWVDRVFSARGSGTVVTGTLVDGSLAVDDDVVIEPGGRAGRVRAIESRNQQHQRVGPGTRIALNLAGVDHTTIQRGDAVVRPDQFAVVATVDVLVHMLDEAQLPQGEVDVHIGSGEHRARSRVLDATSGFARIAFESELPLTLDDRFVLRSSGAQKTIGGAVVLDVAPARRANEARARLALPVGARIMAAHPWTTAADVARIGGPGASVEDLLRDGHARRLEEWLVAPEELQRVRDAAVSAVRGLASDAPGADLATTAASCGIDATRLRIALTEDGRVRVERDLIRDASADAVADNPAAVTFLTALAEHPFTPPAPADVGTSPAIVRALTAAGAVANLDGIVFGADALDEARRRVAKVVANGGTLTVAAARELLGSTRKFVLPILTRLDADGITRRRGDERIAGPRAVDWA